MKTNFDNKEVKLMANYADWDIEEIETTLTTMFPNANEITVDDIKPDALYVTIDNKSLAFGPDGEIIEE